MIKTLLDNWFLKLISFCLALVLWFFVMGEQRSEVGMTAPLELVNIPEGLMISNEVPNLIDLRISGPRTLLMNLNQDDTRISVDLEGVHPGMATIRKLDERLDIPSGLKVTRLSPSYIDIKLDRITDKLVPVIILLDGSPAEFHHVGEVNVQPKKVRVRGAESELKSIEDVRIEAISLEGVKTSFSLMAQIDYKGNYSKIVDEYAVEVSVEVISELPEGATEVIERETEVQ
jgi:YbbR domain-containing protein